MKKFLLLLPLLQIILSTQNYYSNPLIPQTNLPDPGAIYYEGSYYIVTTTDKNEDQDKFPIRVSSDLIQWTQKGHVFPSQSVPSWTKQDFWAPEIHMVGKYFVVYYAARDQTGVLCIGAAFSSIITGPYTDLGKPLIRNSSVGNIDSTYFYDNVTDRSFIIWKEDGNGLNPPEVYTPIWIQALSSDGLRLVGDKKNDIKE